MLPYFYSLDTLLRQWNQSWLDSQNAYGFSLSYFGLQSLSNEDNQ